MDDRSPRLRVFVVDDSPEACDLLARQLRLAGHDLVDTYSQSIGIASRVEALAKRGPLVVLLDMTWPGPNGGAYGPHVARICKRVKGVRVFFCSSVDGQKMEDAVRESGADGWFSKSEAATIGDRLAAIAKL